MDHSTRTISVRTAQDLLVELIRVQFKIQHEETTTTFLPLSLRIGFCDIRDSRRLSTRRLICQSGKGPFPLFLWQKTKKTRKDILSPLCYPVLLLDFYYFNCDDAHSVLFCYFPLCALLFMLCASFWSFLVIEYAKKQSQPT